jgi:hypothetical protein
MHGNYPYVGDDGASASPGSVDPPELDRDQRQQLRDGLSGIVDRTRRFLPDEYVVDSRLAADDDGVYAAVAVEPPIGNAVSARFAPELGEDDAEAALADTDRDELARNLAASAALQAKAASGDPPRTAR